MNIKTLGLGLGAFAAGAAAWTWGAGRYGDKVAKALDFGSRDGTAVKRAGTQPPAGDASAATASASEHVPVDLAADTPVGRDTRAPAAFRPDPTAIPTDAEREALRPATGPAPTLVADRGSGFSEAAGAA